MIRDDTTVKPKEASQEDLMVVHTKDYLNSLKVMYHKNVNLWEDWKNTRKKVSL